MKKFFALLIALLYLTVSSGLAVEIHHCMGEITDFNLATSKSDKCSSCGMQKGSNKCCKDELKFVKLQDSYKLLHINYKLNVPEADLHSNYYQVNTNSGSLILIINGKSLSPPRYSTTSRRILNCVFRI